MMASLAVPTKRVSTTLRAKSVPSARIGLARGPMRAGSEFNKLAEELNSHRPERCVRQGIQRLVTGPDLSGKGQIRSWSKTALPNILGRSWYAKSKYTVEIHAAKTEACRFVFHPVASPSTQTPTTQAASGSFALGDQARRMPPENSRRYPPPALGLPAHKETA